MLKNIKIATRTSILVTLILVIGFWGLWMVIDNKMTSVVENQIINQMTDSVQSRAYIINNYVESVEEYMAAFAKSDEVKNALLHPEDAKIIERAQQYTESFANIKGIFEGLYIATPETLVLTHSIVSSVGIVTRKGDALKKLTDELFDEEEIYNTGILKSPSTGQMCISMYYPVFDGGKPIGFVGSAVYASQLMESLISLDVEGLPDSEYVFLNAATGEYLYNENEDLLCTITEEKGYIEILERVNKNASNEKGIVEYVDKNGISQVVVYRLIPERNWVFALKDTKDNVYSEIKDVRTVTAGVCVAMAVVIILVLILILSNLGRQLTQISSAINKLGDMDLSANRVLEKYKGQKDEVGIICEALNKTCNNLTQYIGEVGEQLSHMSEGDFTRKSTVAFAGEFVKLKGSMTTIQKSLKSSFSTINTVTGELVIGAESVANTSSNLAGAAAKANELLMQIDSHVSDITNELSESADFASTAKNDANEAAMLVENSKTKMEELTQAMKQIKETTEAIEAISNNLENIAKQTNILALNALVEASRAGDAGRGFGVVADEIRNLADQSSVAANNAYDLINQTTMRVNEGMRISDETASYLEQVVTQTNTIDNAVSRIAESTILQKEKLQSINERLDELNQSVEVTANMAQQSAAASAELDGQINALRDNVRRYKV